MKHLLDIYDIEKTCNYRGEIYHVRDNGSIFRCRRPNKRKRPLDEKWTFGTPNKANGYMNVASETVHRIVASAFHGNQPTEKHIVDHIDTNKRNNRPENLRWITRLENLLVNPITRKRIIYNYGSLDNFFENPEKPIHKIKDKNFEWMRTVSKEEAAISKKKLLKWVKEGTVPRGGELGEWLLTQHKEVVESKTVDKEYIQSLTPNAVQRNWKTPNKFPNCPKTLKENDLNNYKTKLVNGSVFSESQYGESIVEESEINTGNKELIVMTRSQNIKPYALAKVYIENGCFIHENLGSFLKLDSAEKEYTLALGLNWEGGETFDELIG